MNDIDNISILKCAITVVWVLVILGTLGSQRFPRILEETLDIISFMWVFVLVFA